MSDSSFFGARLRRGDMPATEKVWQVSWSLIFWVACIFAFGFAMLYSAGNGNFMPWAWPQLVRFGIGIGIVIAVAVVDIRVLLRHAYLFYGIVFFGALEQNEFIYFQF